MRHLSKYPTGRASKDFSVSVFRAHFEDSVFHGPRSVDVSEDFVERSPGECFLLVRAAECAPVPGAVASSAYERLPASLGGRIGPCSKVKALSEVMFFSEMVPVA